MLKQLKIGSNNGSDTLIRDPTRPGQKSLTRWPRDPVPSLVPSVNAERPAVEAREDRGCQPSSFSRYNAKRGRFSSATYAYPDWFPYAITRLMRQQPSRSPVLRLSASFNERAIVSRYYGRPM